MNDDNILLLYTMWVRSVSVMKWLSYFLRCTTINRTNYTNRLNMTQKYIFIYNSIRLTNSRKESRPEKSYICFPHLGKIKKISIFACAS